LSLLASIPFSVPNLLSFSLSLSYSPILSRLPQFTVLLSLFLRISILTLYRPFFLTFAFISHFII
jgi:hypothetical protein